MQGKGLKFTKEQLEELYVQQGLSLSQIGEMFGCNGTNILYWMKKYKIPRKDVCYRRINVSKEMLEELYVNQKLSSLQIAERLGIKHSKTVRKIMKRLDIPTRTLSEASRKKFRRSFDGNDVERAFLLGLRTGDFHAKWMHKSIRVQTTTTHLAQIDLLRHAFEKYGKICVYLSKDHRREDEWFIYVDLDESFEFLIEKPEEIPKWILEKDENFYAFFTGYSDCEGSFTVVRSHRDSVRFVFSIASGDKQVLLQSQGKLQSLGYTAQFYLSTPKGKRFGNSHRKFRKSVYDLTLYPKNEVVRLITTMLPFSKHSEKIRKMRYIFENRKVKSWITILPGWDAIREEIKNELLKNQKKKEKSLIEDYPRQRTTG